MGRNDEKGGRNNLIPVPMFEYWRAVILRLNAVLKADYKYPYVAEVYKGQRSNREIEEVIDGCVEATNRDFAARGLKPRYPVEPRMAECASVQG